MKQCIIYSLLTLILWPLAVVAILFEVRSYFVKYPERLSLPDTVTIAWYADNWLSSVGSKLFSLKSRIGTLHKPLKVKVA